MFALDDKRVLRRYRRVTDVTAEAEVMSYVAGLGYPVPAVFEAHGSDLVLERLDGPTMAQALADGDIGIAAGADMLANLLQTLHELPTWPGAEPADRASRPAPGERHADRPRPGGHRLVQRHRRRGRPGHRALRA